MNITERDITENLLYEYLRKCGLDDTTAVNVALSLQNTVQQEATQHGGSPEQVPED